MSDEIKQGELKSRIKKELNIDWGDQLFENADYNRGKLVTQEQIFDKILDEARADFPTYAYAVGLWIGRTGRPVNDGLSEAGVQQILASERELWFKKWFGGAP